MNMMVVNFFLYMLKKCYYKETVFFFERSLYNLCLRELFFLKLSNNFLKAIISRKNNRHQNYVLTTYLVRLRLNNSNPKNIKCICTSFITLTVRKKPFYTTTSASPKKSSS